MRRLRIVLLTLRFYFFTAIVWPPLIANNRIIVSPEENTSAVPLTYRDVILRPCRPALWHTMWQICVNSLETGKAQFTIPRQVDLSSYPVKVRVDNSHQNSLPSQNEGAGRRLLR